MKYGTLPSRWLDWADTWDASFLLGVAKHLEDNGIDPQKATRDQVSAAVRVLRFKQTGESRPRLHPQSWQELRQLVKLHGANAVLEAVRIIQREQPTEQSK
jgi:hypothetical protein